VGRGPLAGPVVTAAVILPHDFHLLGVDDSKRLTDQERERLYREILAVALDISIGVGDAQLIDRENIYHATEIVMGQAVRGLYYRPQFLLVDAMTVPVRLPQRKLIKGDQQSASIGAASIVAKQVRDHLMAMYDQVYHGYDFVDNCWLWHGETFRWSGRIRRHANSSAQFFTSAGSTSLVLMFGNC
jgi:ribonuclease HII